MEPILATHPSVADGVMKQRSEVACVITTAQYLFKFSAIWSGSLPLSQVMVWKWMVTIIFVTWLIAYYAKRNRCILVLAPKSSQRPPDTATTENKVEEGVLVGRSMRWASWTERVGVALLTSSSCSAVLRAGWLSRLLVEPACSLSRITNL